MDLSSGYENGGGNAGIAPHHFFESKTAKAKHPAIAIAQPRILGQGNVSPTVKKYKATNITTRFSVFPTAVGTGPREDNTMFCISL